MEYESWFDTSENKTLLAICARKLISNIGIGGLIWGVINIAWGIVATRMAIINVGIVILGVIMLGTGIWALKRPTIGVLLAVTIVTILLLTWNVGVALLNLVVVGMFDPRGLIFPLIIAVVFFNYFRRLKHLEQQIASVQPDEIKKTKAICKGLVKKKLKDEPTIVETSNRKCRVQLMDDKGFFIQRDLMKAFVASKDQIRELIVKPDAKKLQMRIRHPLGKLKFAFDKRSSEKLQNWLSAGPEATTGTAEEASAVEPV